MPNNNQFNSSFIDSQKVLREITNRELTSNNFSDEKKEKLDGIENGAQVNVNADWNASTGNAQILNKPKIPEAQVNSNWNATSGVAEILNKPTIPSITNLVPYTGATQDVDLNGNDLYLEKLWLNDAVNSNFGSLHFTDGNFHIEDADNHKLIVIEDGFIQLHKTDLIQSNLFTENLTQTRDHYLPNKSGTIALTSNITGINSGTNTGDETTATIKTKLGITTLSGSNTGDQDLSGLVVKNAAIVGASKTKITYDAKGLVTTGADATTADISDSTNKRYVTDANLTTIGNQSGVNTGDETTSTIKTKLGITTLSGSNTGDQDLSGLTPNTRSISTTTPLQGGGDLSANRTLSILQSNTSQSGYLSNTDWNTFNGKQTQLNGTGFVKATGTTISYDNSNYNPIIISDYIGGTLTGTLTNTILKSYFIPANTFKQNDCFNFNVGLHSNATKLGGATLRVYTNTTNSLTGASILATYAYVTTNRYALLKRTGIFFQASSGIALADPTFSIVSDEIANTNGFNSQTFLFQQDTYFIVACQLSNIADSVNSNIVRLTK